MTPEPIKGLRASYDNIATLRADLAAAREEIARLRLLLTAIRENATDPETVLANVDAALTGGTDE